MMIILSNSRQHAVHLRPLLRGLLGVEGLELLQDRRSVVVVPVLRALVAGQFPFAVAVGERVEDGLGVGVAGLASVVLLRRQRQVLQLHPEASRTGVHIIQSLDQNISGDS